jgi:uncharacterized protein YydD (DUF2326 family)
MNTESENMLEKVQQVVGNYFEVSLKGNEEVLNFVKSRPFIENITTLCERNRNMEKRLKALEPILKQYQEDSRIAIKQVVDEYIKNYKETITKEQAAKVLSGMTLQEIMNLIY